MTVCLDDCAQPHGGDTLVIAKYDEIIIWDDNIQTKYSHQTQPQQHRKLV